MSTQTPLPKEIYEDPKPPDLPVSRTQVSPDNPPWGLLGALGGLVLYFVLMLVVQTAFLLLYILKRGVPLTPEAIGEFATKDLSAIFVQIASIIPAHVLMVGAAWVIVTRFGKYPFLKTLGWEPDARFTFWKCVGLAVALLVAAFCLLKLTSNPETALDRLVASSRAAALATAFVATFTAPLVEEIVFRGLLYSALQRLIGTAGGVAVVVLLFALIHVPQYWPNFGVIGTILLLSFVLTTIRARTGKLLPCFIVHLVFNAIQSFGIVLSPYIERLFPEKSPALGALLHVFVNLSRSLF